MTTSQGWVLCNYYQGVSYMTCVGDSSDPDLFRPANNRNVKSDCELFHIYWMHVSCYIMRCSEFITYNNSWWAYSSWLKTYWYLCPDNSSVKPKRIQLMWLKTDPWILFSSSLSISWIFPASLRWACPYTSRAAGLFFICLRVKLYHSRSLSVFTPSVHLNL